MRLSVFFIINSTFTFLVDRNIINLKKNVNKLLNVQKFAVWCRSLYDKIITARQRFRSFFVLRGRRNTYRANKIDIFGSAVTDFYR